MSSPTGTYYLLRLSSPFLLIIIGFHFVCSLLAFLGSEHILQYVCTPVPNHFNHLERSQALQLTAGPMDCELITDPHQAALYDRLISSLLVRCVAVPSGHLEVCFLEDSMRLSHTVLGAINARETGTHGLGWVAAIESEVRPLPHSRIDSLIHHCLARPEQLGPFQGVTLAEQPKQSSETGAFST